MRFFWYLLEHLSFLFCSRLQTGLPLRMKSSLLRCGMKEVSGAGEGAGGRMKN